MLPSFSTFSRSSLSMVNRLLQVMSFSCACVCGGKKKIKKITQHLANQNFYSALLTPPPEQMCLHEAFPYNDNNLPAPIKTASSYIR